MPKQIVPGSLIPYIGPLTVSKGLLQGFELSCLGCDVQTCQQCKTSASGILTWHPPEWLGFFDVDIQLRGKRLYVSSHAPRLVPLNAKVWSLIEFADVDGLRALFDTGQASVYDVDVGGDILLRVSASLRRHSLITERKS